MNKVYCRALFAFSILCAFFFYAAFAPAWAATPLAVGQTCALNNGSCGSAATRGNGNVTQTTSGCAQGAGEYCGAKADPGFNAVPVYAWNHCRYITNELPVSSIFVPFGNVTDWTNFYTVFKPLNSTVLLQDCSIPATFTISPDASCTNPVFSTSTYSSTPVVALGYAPWSSGAAATQTVTAKYSCSNSVTAWVEYETVTYTGLDSDYYNPSWSAGLPVCSMNSVASGIACGAPTSVPPTITLTTSASTVTLGNPVTLTWTVTNATSCTAGSNDNEGDWTGSKAFSNTNSQSVHPALSPTTTYTLSCTGPGGTGQQSVSVGTVILGQCGSANNVAVSSAPTSGLCNAGQASAVSGTGPWTWSCAGSTAVTTASCTAPAVGNPSVGTCTMTNPILASFSANGSYVISGTGNSYSVVGSEGTVLMSGFTHSANISGDGNSLDISGGSNCVSLSGSNEQILISGRSQTLNLSGSSTTVSISGANDNISMNLSSGSSVSLSISGSGNNITIIGDGYTIGSLSGTGNSINGVPLN